MIALVLKLPFRKSSQPSGGGADKAQMAFKLYDKDKDGYITKAEMVKLSKNLTKEQVEKVFKKNLCSTMFYPTISKQHRDCGSIEISLLVTT